MCLENRLQNGFSFLTEWFVLMPKKPSQTHCLLYYRMASPDPIFSHREEAYNRRVDRSHSVEEMARARRIDIYNIIIECQGAANLSRVFAINCDLHESRTVFSRSVACLKL